MELTSEYKQTEVGVFPEDWSVKHLSALADVKTGPFGSALHESDYVSDGTPIITVEHLSEQGVAHENLPFVSEVDRKRLSSYSLRTGDIVFSRVGSVDRSALIRNSEDGWLFSGRLLRVRLLSTDVHAPYLSYHFCSEPFKQRVRTVSVGQTMASLNTQILKGICAVLPTLSEQRAIATALSDVDALLAALDRLITKKRDLKLAAMQQLLTGQTRLPSFHGEWEVERLGDHVTFLRNGTNSRAELTQDDPVKYLHYGDVHASVGAELRPNALPSLPSEKVKSLARLQDGDLVFADASEDLAGVCKSVEMRGVADTETVPGLHTIAARFDKRVLVDGFKSYLQFCPTFSSQLRQLAAGTKVYAISRAHIASIKVRLPGVEEQTAIAAVLVDMDAELSALEARRDKTQDLKKAMMQELLTGRTRLI